MGDVPDRAGKLKWASRKTQLNETPQFSEE
jgi:hypothetical protein